MKLIVGLGNPGRAYSETRHNIGSSIVKSLAKEYKVSLRRGIFSSSLSGKARIAGKDVLLALPLVFMNLSGSAVAALVKKHKIDLSELLVVFDDLDLEPGRLKLKSDGSSAGHRGLESVIRALGNAQFCRLRIGIGRPKNCDADISRYVLSRFLKKEEKIMALAVETASQAVRTWVIEGISKTMNIFNR
jgi:PTH1 family peptidyl-tRNA hydrolase